MLLATSLLCPRCGTRQRVVQVQEKACPVCGAPARERHGLRVECPVCQSLPGHRCGDFFRVPGHRNKHPWCHDERVQRERRETARTISKEKA